MDLSKYISLKVLTVILLFSQYQSIAQSIEIQGFFNEVKDSTKISFSESVDTNYKNYWMNYESVLIFNNSFKKYFYFKGTGSFGIESSICTPVIELIADENSKIKMFVNKNQAKYDISFQGDNALGLTELNNSKFKFKTLYPLVENCFQNTKNSFEFMNKLLKLRSELWHNFDTLLSKKEITKSFYDQVQNTADLQLLFVANYIMEGHKEDLKIKNDLIFSEQELNKIIVDLDNRYNAFDVKYEKCLGIRRLTVIQQKCLNISKEILKGIKTDIGIWESYQNHYSYAPLNLQELLMVGDINFLGFEKGGNCSFEKFKEKFPNSPYLFDLEKLNNDNLKSNSAVLPYTFATYSSFSKKIETQSTNQFAGLQELIKEKFKEKPVFVDLWATYCAPCKKEFSYSGNLLAFLQKNNIDILYVSVDPKGLERKWQKDIQSFKLYGKHYFASEDILNSIQKLLNEKTIGVPRYLLFNSKGVLILKNTKKPSDGQILYDEILNALK